MHSAWQVIIPGMDGQLRSIPNIIFSLGGRLLASLHTCLHTAAANSVASLFAYITACSFAIQWCLVSKDTEKCSAFDVLGSTSAAT